MKKTVFFLLAFLFIGGYLILNSLNTDLDKTEGKFLDDFNRIFGIVASTLTTVLLASKL